MKAAGLMRSKLSGWNRACGALFAAAVLGSYAGAAHALAKPWQLNLTPGVTQTSHEVYQIHMWGFYVCCIIGLLVFGAMAVAMFRFRKSKGYVPATWSHNTTVEIIWTVVPVAV